MKNKFLKILAIRVILIFATTGIIQGLQGQVVTLGVDFRQHLVLDKCDSSKVEIGRFKLTNANTAQPYLIDSLLIRINGVHTPNTIDTVWVYTTDTLFNSQLLGTTKIVSDSGVLKNLYYGVSERILYINFVTKLCQPFALAHQWGVTIWGLGLKDLQLNPISVSTTLPLMSPYAIVTTTSSSCMPSINGTIPDTTVHVADTVIVNLGTYQVSTLMGTWFERFVCTVNSNNSNALAAINIYKNNILIATIPNPIQTWDSLKSNLCAGEYFYGGSPYIDTLRVEGIWIYPQVGDTFQVKIDSVKAYKQYDSVIHHKLIPVEIDGTPFQTRKVVFTLPTSVQNLHSTNNIKIFPNPTTKFVTIDGEMENIRLLSVDGRTLLQTNENVLLLESLSPGVYILEIETKLRNYRTKITKQ